MERQRRSPWVRTMLRGQISCVFIVAVVVFCVTGVTGNPTTPPQHQHHAQKPPHHHHHHNTAAFDAAFRRFLRDHNYTGGSVAALKDGRLLLAKGYGLTRDGTEVKVGARTPISALSQSLTAVAVLRLAQQGLLDLDDKVFGERGILSALTPLAGGDPASAAVAQGGGGGGGGGGSLAGGGGWRGADPRLADVTVGHLLRHSAGWDPTVAPLYDPLLNQVYQARGHAVPNLARLLHLPTPLDPLALIRYALSRPLHYSPGTRVVPSNLGYLVLGRLVEEVSGMSYGDYVKKFVLKPCGMWHTHLGDPAGGGTTASSLRRRGHRLDEDVPREDTPLLERKLDEGLDLFDTLDPVSVDSALGWYSNVFDMARFARCVFDGDEVLTDASLELLLQRQDMAPVRRGESWVCAGFRTDTRGAVWQEGDPHAHDALLFHDLLADRDDDRGKDGALPDTWVVLLHGNHLHHLRHKTRDLMRELGGVVRDESVRNSFVHDLSDVDAASAGDDVLVKFRVDEHHLDAYLSAARQEGYNVRWVSPYTHRRRTSFLLVCRLTTSTTEAEVDFRVEHGLSEKHLLSRKLHNERRGYNLTFLQSYHSQSHADGYTFLAVFRKHAYPTDTQLKYGTDHLPEPYDKLVQMYHEKLFHPLVQSVLPRRDDKEEHLSFVFLQTPHSKPVDFKNYYRLSDGKLERTVLLNADHGRTLSFLDAYQLQGRARFAAVFTNESKPRWHFQGGLTRPQTALLIESRLADGLWPSLLIAYVDKDKELKYAVFLRSDEDARHASEGSQGRRRGGAGGRPQQSSEGYTPPDHRRHHSADDDDGGDDDDGMGRHVPV